MVRTELIEAPIPSPLPSTQTLSAAVHPAYLPASQCTGQEPNLHPQQPSSQNIVNSAATLSVLTSCGGIIGYARTGSIPSIAAGLSVGALYALSYYRLQGQQPFGEELSLIASTVLAGSAIPRALKTRKPVPIGLSILATYGLIVFGLAYKGKRAARV